MDFTYNDCISLANTIGTLSLGRFRLLSLYDCCQLDASDLVEGTTGATGIHEELTKDDLILCVAVRYRLAIAREAVQAGPPCSKVILSLATAGSIVACSSTASKVHPA